MEGWLPAGIHSRKRLNLPIVVRVDGKLMVVNFLQPEKVFDGISFKISERCTSVRLVQLLNEYMPILFKFSDNFAVFSELQYSNADR